jgi:predicted phage gp36 major capsid-like protein
MYKISLILLVFVLFANAINSQPTEMKVDTLAKSRSNFLKNELKLDDAQSRQVYEMERRRLTVTDSLQRFGRNMAQDDRKRVIEKMLDDYSTDMQKILTEEQWKTFTEGEAKRHNRALSDKARIRSKITPL